MSMTLPVFFVLVHRDELNHSPIPLTMKTVRRAADSARRIVSSVGGGVKQMTVFSDVVTSSACFSQVFASAADVHVTVADDFQALNSEAIKHLCRLNATPGNEEEVADTSKQIMEEVLNFIYKKSSSDILVIVAGVDICLMLAKALCKLRSLNFDLSHDQKNVDYIRVDIMPMIRHGGRMNVAIRSDPDHDESE